MTKVEGGGVPVGTQLNGIYEIDERVAMGGMGEVYIGHNIQTGDKVAIKMILPELAHNQTILDLFRKEASTLNRLSHEAIVRYHVFTVDPTLDRPYLAMEYAAGPSLVDRLRDQPLSADELSVLRHRIASGLHAAHKLGVFHRDISPDNVILVDGKVDHAKIIDFGIAKSTASGGTLIGGGFAGKLNYVSPEQLGLGGGEVTGKSDIYSLGLVLAEAAIGKPLPMGGSQVEVLDKRRSVPDLSEVPAQIRPLIEWMLQPEPEDRPADMDEVANWGRPVREQTAPPQHRAPPRPGAAKAPKKRGFPWMVTGLVAAAAAGAAILVVMQGGETPGPGPDVTLDPGLTAADPTVKPVTAAATLAAPQSGEVTAKRATAGLTYTWVSPAFDYSGDAAALEITLLGQLPEGLEFENGGDATGVVYGIPAAPGETRFRIKAVSPEGQEAVLAALLVVDPAGVAALEPQIPTVPPPPPPSNGSAVTGGDISLGATGGAGGGSTGGGTASELAPTTGGSGDSGALATLPVDSGQTDPGAGSSEPSVAIKIPKLDPGGSVSGGTESGISTGGLSGIGDAGSGGTSAGLPQLPSTGAGTDSGSASALGALPVDSGQTDPGAGSSEPSVAIKIPKLDLGGAATGGTESGISTGGLSGIGDAGSGGASAGLPELPKTGAGADPGSASALGALPIDSGQTDPGAASSEPSITALVPQLQSGEVITGGGSLGGVGDSGGFQLPKTGRAGTEPPQLGQPDAGSSGEPLVAVIPPQSENLPPKILDHLLVPVEGSHGEEINLRLGAFDDEEGAGALAVRVEGRLPNGMQFINAGGGVAQLYGRPVESGNFSFEVVAVDPQGLMTRFPVALSVSAPAEFRDLREYIVGYNGGDCFLSRPLELSQQAARIEVFVAEADPLYKFDGDFKRDRGFEAAIEGRLITPAQCGLMHALDQVGPHALDNRLQFRIVKDQLKSGQMLEGVVEGGAQARLFLYDNEGGVTDLAQFVTPGPAGAAFKLPLHADGPQVLVAAIAEPTSGLGASAGLELLLGAARDGSAALALGYIVVEK